MNLQNGLIRSRILVAFFALLSMVFFSGSSIAVGLSKIEKNKVIIFRGYEFSKAMKTEISELSLMAMDGRNLSPIPYQIDEVNINGVVYFSDGKVPIDGQEKILDSQDEILFMMRDAGDKKGKKVKVDGKVLYEIKIITAAGGERYIYLVEGSRLRSDETYVRYSSDIRRVETEAYTIALNEKNLLFFDEYQFAGYKGPHGEPFDGVKLKMKTGIVLPFPRYSFGSKYIKGRSASEHIGPVRTTVNIDVRVSFLKIPLQKYKMQVQYFPYSTTYATDIPIKRYQRALLSNPEISIYVDGNQLEGSTLETANLPTIKGFVDSKVSEDESELIENGISRENAWMRLKTPYDLDVFAFFELMGEHDMEVGLYYDDNFELKDKPERFQGVGPAMGYTMTNPPWKAVISGRSHLYSSQDFGDLPTTLIVDQLVRRPKVLIQ